MEKQSSAFSYKDGSDVTGPWGEKDKDIKDGDIVTIANAGGIIEGKYGDQKVFLFKTPQGEFLFNLNRSSESNLVGYLGDDSEQWVGMKAKACINTENVSGTMRRVLYFVHPDGDLIDPVPAGATSQEPKATAPAQKKPDYPSGDDEIDPEDIPF